MSTASCSRVRSLLLFAALVGLVYPVLAATLKPGFTETIVASGLGSPTAMAFAPDGRLFVCNQTGQLRVIENNQLLPTPFLTVTVNSSGERGLLGVAFDPSFPTNNFVYVYYTATSPTIHNRVSRFTANGNVAVAGSETVLLDLPTLSATNHNGGAMHFGIDGRLYIAVGDNAVGSNSQSLATPLGKMLRINPDGTIPSTNPFFNQTTGINRAIWALGLRNPFTFSFQPTSGRMFINDVGQNTWEEINEGAPGANYGWPATEGATTNPAYVTPVYSYSHGGGAFQGCAITGGAFYAGLPAQFPDEYVGDYFFADYCTGWINQLDETGGVVTVSTFASGIASPVDLAVGPDGSLYYLARGSTGVVVRITFTGSQAPAITQHPASQTVSVGQSASFTVGASGAPPLSYQWQRNGTPISGATSATYTLASATLGDSGAQFRAVVTNASGNATSNVATLTVVANQPPVPTIITPAAGALYSAGTTLNFSGSASDPETGAVPASNFTWRIDFHHDAHTHPFYPATSGIASGSVSIPRVGHTETTVWYRVHLTVVDGAGQSASTFTDVQPRIVTMTLSANPSGASLTLDGQPVVAPRTFASVVGVERVIGAMTPITIGNRTYDFTAWSDGGAQTHTITTPSANQTITATYRKRKGRT